MNCVRNYPWYKDWHKTFPRDQFTILGIHTPELSSEHGLRNVQADAKKKGLAFPILVDDEEKHWDRWGNSMWPSLYLIDKEGYARFWWYGELDWHGSDNHLLAKKRIQELLAEK